MRIKAHQSDGKGKCSKRDDNLDATENRPKNSLFMKKILAPFRYQHHRYYSDWEHRSGCDVDERWPEVEFVLLESKLEKDQAYSYLLQHLSDSDNKEKDQVIEEQVVNKSKNALCKCQAEKKTIS